MTDQALFDRVLARLSSEYTDVVIMTGVYTKDFALELAANLRAQWEWEVQADYGTFWRCCGAPLDLSHSADCKLIALLKALDREPT